MDRERIKWGIDHSEVKKQISSTLPELFLQIQNEFKEEFKVKDQEIKFISASAAVKKIGLMLGIKNRDDIDRVYAYFRTHDILDFQRVRLANGTNTLLISQRQLFATGAIFFTARDSLISSYDTPPSLDAPWRRSPKLSDRRKIVSDSKQSLLDCGKPEIAELIKTPSSNTIIQAAKIKKPRIDETDEGDELKPWFGGHPSKQILAEAGRYDIALLEQTILNLSEKADSFLTGVEGESTIIAPLAMRIYAIFNPSEFPAGKLDFYSISEKMSRTQYIKILIWTKKTIEANTKPSDSPGAKLPTLKTLYLAIEAKIKKQYQVKNGRLWGD